jgi:hypothetical protein
MKKLIYRALVGVFVLMVTSSCYMYVVRYDGAYRGRVIDADTGDPIEGVVVLGVWNLVLTGAAGAVHEYYDARETVTDKNGEFSIPGMGLRILSRLAPMGVWIFKAGYEYSGGSWPSLHLAYNSEVKWEGDRAIIPLKKLTMEERKRRYGPPGPPSEAQRAKKAQRYIEEINKDRRERGLRELRD